jgi:hypothetical protein
MPQMRVSIHASPSRRGQAWQCEAREALARKRLLLIRGEPRRPSERSQGQLTCASGRKEIIAPAGLDPATADQSRTNRSLAVMVARAHRWQALLESGRSASIPELALDVGVDNSYLSRMPRLTPLAPDFIEAILDGTESNGLSLEKLYRLRPEWKEQRRVLEREEQVT